MDLGLKGKIIVVSGSAGKAGSIGETIINRLADEGAIPVLVDRNDSGYDYVAESSKKRNRLSVCANRCDRSSPNGKCG